LTEEQFYRLLKGDRYFFGHLYVGSRFSVDQIWNIRNIQLSDIICHNTNITATQEYVFSVFDPSWNPMRYCSNANDINWSYY
jgi:hypothetical protein